MRNLITFFYLIFWSTTTWVEQQQEVMSSSFILIVPSPSPLPPKKRTVQSCCNPFPRRLVTFWQQRSLPGIIINSALKTRRLYIYITLLISPLHVHISALFFSFFLFAPVWGGVNETATVCSKTKEKKEKKEMLLVGGEMESIIGGGWRWI